jgi:hypothetical protein
MTRANLILFLGTAGLLGCDQINVTPPDGAACAGHDLGGGPRLDMTPPPAPCAAAAGLPGTNLVCIDFSQVSGLNDPKLTGWDFTSQCPAGWSVASGELQLKDYSTFMGTCDFTMPTLSAADYQNYNNFTLSVIQTVDVNSLKQAVSIYLGLPLPAQQIWNSTGSFPAIKMGTTLQAGKANLPNGGSGMYQPLFQITSGVQPNPNQGWLIQSIAVNASQ